jgi:hypothetical protein
MNEEAIFNIPKVACSLLKYLQRNFHHFSDNEVITFTCQKGPTISPKSFLKQLLSLLLPDLQWNH